MKKLLITLLICKLAIFYCGCTAHQKPAIIKTGKEKIVFDDKVLFLPKEKRDARFTSSCANHFIALRLNLKFTNDIKPDMILPSTNDTKKALNEIFTPLRGDSLDWLDGQPCPESHFKGEGMGYVYVGDGLKLKDVVEKDILILFCPGENHRGTSDHCHAWKTIDNDSKSCATNQDMIKELKRAISRGESGDVAYSPRAMKVLRKELKKREE